MAAITFSLTNEYAVNPIIDMRQPSRYPDICDYFISEVIARIMAVSISIFAACDACIHLASSIYKGFGLILADFGIIGRIHWVSDDVWDHLCQTVCFIGLAVIGSVAGVIYPEIIQEYLDDFSIRPGPAPILLNGNNPPPQGAGGNPPPQGAGGNPPPQGAGINPSLQGVGHKLFAPNPKNPRHQLLQQLAQAVQNKQEIAPFRQLQAWINEARQYPAETGYHGNYSNTEAQELGLFVQTFEENDSAEYQAVRAHFGPILYRNINSLSGRVTWLSPNEVDARIQAIVMSHINLDNTVPLGADQSDVELDYQLQMTAKRFEYERQLNGMFYFHGTKYFDRALLSILGKNGQKPEIRVMHDGSYKGAFMSTFPEPQYGPYYLIFRKATEWTAGINQDSYLQRRGSFWSGLLLPIPLNDATLIGIACKDESQEQCDQLSGKITATYKRDIPVFPLAVVVERLELIRDLNMGNPRRWSVRDVPA